MLVRTVCLLAVLSALGCQCCNDRVYYGGCQGCGIAGAIKSVASCQKGCGEIYWGDWFNDPPDDCDPCDDCGNFVGPRCHGYRPLCSTQWLAAAQGKRYCEDATAGHVVAASHAEPVHTSPAPAEWQHDPQWQHPAPRVPTGVPSRTGRARPPMKSVQQTTPGRVKRVAYEVAPAPVAEASETTASAASDAVLTAANSDQREPELLPPANGRSAPKRLPR
jgi:hypothetical protein